MKLYYHIAIAELRTGQSLDRWQNSITAMIEKIPGCPRIHKIRVIHLFEADYNLLLKIRWARRLVWNANDAGKLDDGQAGSRPGRNAIDVVVQKEMKYLYSHLTRTGMATMDNDVKCCYNQIICNLVMNISQYYGLSSTTMQTQATTLQKMRYWLQTALGDSTLYYQHTEETPIHGTGQGSCASPCIWLLISIILMDCLAELGGGVVMKDVTPIMIQQWIDGFLDNTSLFSNLPRDSTNFNNIQLLHEKLRRDMILW
jgi:hypothetical protein